MTEKSEEQNDLDALFRFDPFSEDDSEQGGSDGEQLDSEFSADGADGAGDAGSQQADSESEDKSKDSAAADDGSHAQAKPGESGEPAKGEEDPRDSKIADLEEQLRQTNAQIQQMMNAQGQGRQDDSGKKSEDSDADEVPDYMFEIPQQIADGIASEDTKERQQALNLLVSGIGRSVHSQLQTQFRKEMEDRVTRAQQEQQSTTQHQTQADTIRQDYFGTFSDHDTDLIRPVVQAKSREVMEEWNVAKWTPRVRDEIGRRVNEELRKSGFRKASDGDEPTPAGKGNGASPPHMRRSGARPATSGGGPNSGQDIESTLFG